MKSRYASAANEPHHLAYIDGLRAVAVLAVVLYHTALAGNAFVPHWMVAGSHGVDLFFVVSGFCLAHPFIVKSVTTTSIGLDARGALLFFLRRFSRIAPPYYVVLAIFAFLAITPFGFPLANGQSTAAPHVTHEFIKDLLFLTSKSPIFNSSFWTLGIEARWYLLCPMLIALFVRSRPLFYMAGATMYGLYWLTPFSIADEGTLPCFMLGIVAADLAIRKNPLQSSAWLAAIVFGACAALERAHGTGIDHGDPLWHFACFSIVVAAGSGIVRDVLQWRPIALVGIASYSVYLVHAPVIEVLTLAGVPRPISGIAGLACGLFAYVAIERPLSKPSVRRALETALAAPFKALRNRGVVRERRGPIRASRV